jgi:hypothetical protein
MQLRLSTHQLYYCNVPRASKYPRPSSQLLSMVKFTPLYLTHRLDSLFCFSNLIVSRLQGGASSDIVYKGGDTALSPTAVVTDIEAIAQIIKVSSILHFPAPPYKQIALRLHCNRS